MATLDSPVAVSGYVGRTLAGYGWLGSLRRNDQLAASRMTTRMPSHSDASG